ncbi:His/Gly/Thr/Pro-type tRNA ligase C-terminal domain-containing protein [Fredinandcohnia sp. 179-A 10B2 NHS]|uniref:His/Gly/Thr/Pro-type tRNA ligase C-terminal domain-containing protein n=1 Tax=Fredinandcohnia sp. 179-A 10B2 NHS TaxID=3235176 RepID=UPI0039A1AE6C
MKQSQISELKDVIVSPEVKSNQLPYEIHIIPFDIEEDEQIILSESLYLALQESGYHVLLDDRAVRPEIKFADADLIGLPLCITVGKRASEGILEVKVRHTGETLEENIENLVETIAKYVVK